MSELNGKLDLLSYLMKNGPIKRSTIIDKFKVSARTVDRYTSELIEKHFILKEVEGRDPIYKVNWEYFDYLSVQKNPEYRKGNLNDVFGTLE